jgi:hypothetical protein
LGGNYDSGAPVFARVLALHVAHYQTKHGAIPVEESLQLMLTETINDEQAKTLADGFEVLSGQLFFYADLQPRL